jgi:hypothetical protein
LGLCSACWALLRRQGILRRTETCSTPSPSPQRESSTPSERYRLLNDSWAAESICLDVLAVDPDNQRAVVQMILAITDQFGQETAGDVARARTLLPKIQTDYDRAYYAGIVCERQAKNLLVRNAPGSGPTVYEWLREAMSHYEEAERLRPPGNDDAILRWNTCVRMIGKYDRVEQAMDEGPPTLELE